jgi:hypothetical protein
MSSLVSSPHSPSHSARRRGSHRRTLPRIAPRRTDARGAVELLGGYLDADGCAREVLALPGNGGSVLVLDRDATTLCDRRLLAHLAADEPAENAALVCRHYLRDASRRSCRRVRPDDLRTIPFALCERRQQDRSDATDAFVRDTGGHIYRLGLLPGERSTAQLRWGCRLGETDNPTWALVKLRDVVGALESYEPVRALTEQALVRHRDDPHVLDSRLRCEFERLCVSPIVLNRGLREAVLDAIDRRGTSMSEIALRCGVVKRDRHGNPSGETSWLARRVGLMPEGGAPVITPWIHSDVLAAISRKGLGISPREVELQ